MKVKLTAIVSLLSIVASIGYAAPPLIKTGPGRNATQLQVQLKKIGCLRPKSVKEVGDSNFTIDGAPVDRDFVDFDKYRDYLEPLGVNKIRILTGWAKSEKVKGKLVNAFVVEGATSGRIGFQTKPYPEGRGAVSFRNVRMLQL